jgi:hypothetical protein
MASPQSLRELRFLVGTTFNTTFTNAASLSWNAVDATAHKVRVTEYDDSGLVQEGIEDETLQTRMHAKPAAVEGLRKGTLKISTYAGAAYSNLAVPPEMNIVRAMMGGLQLTTNARSSTISTGSTTTNINVTSADTYVVAGQMCLVGVKGDGRGGGECLPINSVGTNFVETAVACAVAPNTGDAITFSDTAYLDEDAAQQYIDTLGIGHATADQRQTIGGTGTFTVTGMGPGELPKLEIELLVADHQYVAIGDRSSLTPGTGPQSGGVPYERGIGRVHIGDYNDSTRTARKCGSLVFSSAGVVNEEQPSPSGVNGLDGWQHMPGVPTVECTLLFDEDFGLIADWEGQTAKTVIFQLGHLAAGCVAIELPYALLDALPVPEALNNLSGLKLMMHGTEDYVASNDLRSSPVRIHWF